MLIKGLLVFLFSVSAFADKISVLKTLELTEGSYETVLGSGGKEIPNFCENETVDLDVVDDKGELTLTIGSKIGIPSLEKTSFTSEAPKDCQLEVKNKLESLKLEQTWTQTCKNKKNNFVRTHLIENSAGQITYKWTQNKTNKTCSYKLAKK